MSHATSSGLSGIGLLADPFHTIHFDPDDAPPADPADPTPPFQPAAPDPPADPPAAWQPTQDEIRALAAEGSRAALEELLTSLPPDPQAAPQPPGNEPPAAAAFDPYDPQSFEPAVAGILGRVLQEELQPIRGMVDSIAQRELLAASREYLGTLKSNPDIGDGFDEARALALGSVYMGQGLAPEEALTRAAQEDKQYRDTIGQQAVQAYIDAAKNLPNGDPPANPGSGELELEPLRGRQAYDQQARRTMERLTASAV